FMTARLFAFFIHPNPTDAELQPFIDVYTRNDRNVGAVVDAMLRSDAMYSPAAYRAIVKSPVEYAVGAVKALAGPGAVAEMFSPRRASGQIAGMGQSLFEPPNVAGWPGGAAWLNSATMFARLNFINALTSGQAANRPNNRDAVPA